MKNIKCILYHLRTNTFRRSQKMFNWILCICTNHMIFIRFLFFLDSNVLCRNKVKHFLHIVLSQKMLKGWIQSVIANIPHNAKFNHSQSHKLKVSWTLSWRSLMLVVQRILCGQKSMLQLSILESSCVSYWWGSNRNVLKRLNIPIYCKFCTGVKFGTNVVMIH